MEDKVSGDTSAAVAADPAKAVEPKPQAAPAGKAMPTAEPKADKPLIPVKPPAGPAKVKRRHIWLMFSFLLMVLAPASGVGVYLFTVALDQYSSRVGFTVRKEETASAIELLGGITELSGSSSNDTDILYEYIQSPNMVRAVSERLDLVSIYTRHEDPVFSLPNDHRIEALSQYWQRMVKVFFDRSSGLIEIQVRAFSPEDAQAVTLAIFEESNRTVNELSAVGQADATRYAKNELAFAVDRLKQARTAVTDFRIRTQIVDPVADIQGRMGLLNTLQAQLADALISYDLLEETVSRTADPRITQAQLRIKVIRERIVAERNQFSEGDTISAENEIYSQLVGEYEGLIVDQSFAEQAYVAALATFDNATAEAQRKSRYLATYIKPTLSETAEYPRRWVTLLSFVGALLAVWSILTMVYYSLRDRR